MAFYSKRPRDNSEMAGASVETGSWIVWVFVIAVLIGLVTLVYHHIDLITENGAARARVENPVTSPVVPHSSPAPSAN